MQLTPSHDKSLFHRLTSLFERAADKREATIMATKLHRVNFNDTSIAAGTVPIFDIDADPTHPVYIEFLCNVDVVFNAGTTNVLTLGSDLTTALNVFGAADINEAALGMNGPKFARIAARTKFYAKYAQTGGVATTGQATFMATIRGVYDK